MKLFKVIEESGYTRKEVADKIGVTLQTMRNWNKGASHPTVTLFYEMSLVVCVPFYELFKKLYKDEA